MNDQFSIFDLPTWQDTGASTSSPASGDGPKPSASQTGRKICRSGPDRHPVSPSALPGSGSGAMTLDTSPPILSIWSGPAAPECCLASRSQARLCSERLQEALTKHLVSQLGGNTKSLPASLKGSARANDPEHGRGSMIYAIAWKQHVTPLGRTISRQRASARRTSDNAPSSEPFPKSGWPTAQASDGSGGGQAKRAMNPERSNDLMDFAMLAGWSTASAPDWKDTAGMATEATNPDGSTRTRLDQLGRQVQLSGWPTLTARDHFPAHSEEYIAAKKAQGHGMANLNDLGQLAGWPTCTVTDAQRGEKYDPFAANMTLNMAAQRAAWASIDGPARLTAFGHLLIGSTAGMPSGGQLSPAHSRWLMGYRRSWDRAGINAALGMKSKRKKAR